MRRPSRHLWYAHARATVTITMLMLGCLWPGRLVVGQGESIATVPDVIWARKILMNSIGDSSDQIRSMISERAIDLERARHTARSISAMLTAFPHLFPAASNQWQEGVDPDPVTGTIASPDIWTDFADFYKQAMGAAKIANEMSRAANEDELKSFHRALEINCDLCHSLYLKE